MKQATQATFLLRGINHEQLVRDYLSGKFDDLDLPKSKTKEEHRDGRVTEETRTRSWSRKR